MAQFSGRVVGYKANLSNSVFVGSGANISTITATGFAGNGANLLNLNASNMTSGTLGSGVTLDLTNLLYSGTMSGSYISGGTFGTVDASNLINITPGAITSGLLPADVIVSSIAVNAVYGAAILDGAVNSAKIADGSIVNADMAAGTFSNISIPAANINAGSLPSDVIASSIAVNAVEDESIVSVSASKLTGTISNSSLDSSSVTLQGNTFNGANQLVKLDGSGALPAVDGSNLTGIDKYMNFSGYNGTLGVGTTFYASVPSAAITLTKLSVTIVIDGEGGTTGTTWACGDGTNNLTVTTGPSAAPGDTVTATGSVSITAGTKVSGWIVSTDQTITPSANVICEYKQ